MSERSAKENSIGHKTIAKRNSIGHKTMVGIIAFTLLLTIAVSVPVSYGFSMLSRRHYYEDTQDYAGIVAHVIRGDKVLEYVETGKKDGYYDDIEEFLTSFRDEVELTDISVLVPDGNEVVYIWDTDGAEGNYDLGNRTSAFSDYINDHISELNGIDHGDKMLINTQTNKDHYVSVFAPLYDDQGGTAAIVCVTRRQLELGKIISHFILAILTSAAIVSAIVMMIIYRLLKKRIIKPIMALTSSVETMVGNIEREEPVNVDIHTNDELETLAMAFTKMDVDMRDYIKELSKITAERERIGGELDAAAKIQMGILPQKGLQYDDMEECDMAASMVPAREVGGDLYDIFMVDDRHLALVIGDVSGKGVPAALFMVATKILLKYAVKESKSPSEAFKVTNERLMESNTMEFFATAWLTLIDLETGECVEVNAGHEHPALRKKGGVYELVKYKHSLPLATLEGLNFQERKYRLDPGDTIFVYTDGLTEATDSNMNLFGEDRLVQALNKGSEAAPKELLKIVNDSINEFVGDAPQFDDMTMLAFRFNGKQK